jgi:hypothetical protein
LTPAVREAARVETNHWIKRLRLVRYGSQTMRERFTYRRDSLWWFTELYLHKMRRLDAAVETVLALGAAHDLGPGASRSTRRTRPSATRPRRSARARRAHRSARNGRPGRHALAELARRCHGAALQAPIRSRHAACAPAEGGRVRAHGVLVHPDPRRETYIGPVLDALVPRRAPTICCLSAWDRGEIFARGDGGCGVTSRRCSIPGHGDRTARAGVGIGRIARLWRSRYRLAADVTTGDDIRAAASVAGCDLWPVLKRELEAAALINGPGRRGRWTRRRRRSTRSSRT